MRGYGTTQNGGPNGFGSAFAYCLHGNLTVFDPNFNGNNGFTPLGGLVRSFNGIFYGITGSTYPNGAVFEMTPSGAFTILNGFNGLDGKTPFAGLVEGSDGWFSGTTEFGGAEGLGDSLHFSKAIGLVRAPRARSITETSKPGSGSGPQTR